MVLSRRRFLTVLSVSPLAATQASAAPIDLTWSDLVPKEIGVTMERLRALGVVEHGELTTPFDQETGAILTNEYDGQIVRIPGFIVPLDYSGLGVTSFLLVPFVGACIHVPPPPPNQLIFVTTEDPYALSGLFEPISVTGRFSSAATQTMLAEVGYMISADRIRPYGQ